MAYPVLAMTGTWFAPTISSITRPSITEIEIKDSYTPDSSVTVVDSWDASEAKDGSVTCYVIGTKLILAGNGSGRIRANANSNYAFSNPAWGQPYYTNLVSIRGMEYLDTSGVTSMYYMFYKCNSLQNIDTQYFDTSNVTNMSGMFADCYKLTHVDLRSFRTDSFPVNSSALASMFYKCNSLQEVDLSSLDVSNVANIACMFAYCSELTTIKFPSAWMKTGNVTFTHELFESCKKLKGIDTSDWNMSACTNMSFMFYGCSSLGEIDVSNWDVSKVTSFDHFAAHANLKRKGIENWKTTSATNMNALFHNCAEEELDLSGWDVSKNQFFCQMFENSPNLKRIKGLENWDTSSGVGFDGMFERCSKLEEVDLSSFNTMKAKNGVSASTNGHTTATMNNMFLSCNNLKKVTVGPNFSINGDGTNTTAANKAILPTPSSDYIDGADGNWYTFNGDSYAPDAMKDKTAETYYASYDIVADMDVICKNGSLIDTAKAIREKNGTTTQYNPSEFGAAIRALT